MENTTGIDQGIIDKIGKLLTVAAKTQNENEAATFTAKAQELLIAYNLDVSAVEEGSSSSKMKKRVDERFKGGLYEFQRELWEAVAELNFCFYWNLCTWDPDKKCRRKEEILENGRWTRKWSTKKGGYTYEHRVVGRQVNVLATETMAVYLLDTIERVVREKAGDSSEYFKSWAANYRAGMADSIIMKIEDRREQILSEERERERKRQTEIDKANEGKFSSGRDLVISNLTQSEKDANIDFLYGEGTSAKWASERARKAEAARKAEEEYIRWAKENPEEAAAEAKRSKEEREKAARRRPWNYGMSTKRDKYDTGSYWEGREAGDKVSIDQQVESGTAGLLK